MSLIGVKDFINSHFSVTQTDEITSNLKKQLDIKNSDFHEKDELAGEIAELERQLFLKVGENDAV
jgi:hypothetical protein